MADRFYCPDPPREGRFLLEGDEARHLQRVRRVRLGESVELFDGRGFATAAEVVSLGRDQVELLARGNPLDDRAAACELTLATAVPKGDRFDWLVEKATELGVARLVPLLTERSVVDPGPAKIARLRRVVVEASKQCGRYRLMELGEPTPWTTLVAESGATLRLLAHPGGPPPPRWPRASRTRPATLAIGPEGGFTEAEVEAARSFGWHVIGLGSTLLRIETAGLAGCSAILALCEGWDS
jgi:16S rRNA (uracil1498-N3)-methyltransferase